MKYRCSRGKIRVILFLSLLTLASLPAAVFGASPYDAPPPAGPGTGRVWFLRQLIPGSYAYAPMIYANGEKLAISPEGTAFYRDLPAGKYIFNAENCVPTPGASQAVNLHSHTEIALQVQLDENGAWDCLVFYLRWLSPQMVPMAFAPLRYLGQN